MKRDQRTTKMRTQLEEKIDNLKEESESSFCALLIEMRENNKLLTQLINVIDSKSSTTVIERIVESDSRSVDKSKTVYESSDSKFIPEIDTSGLTMSVKESKSKTTKVDLDTSPFDMENK